MKKIIMIIAAALIQIAALAATPQQHQQGPRHQHNGKKMSVEERQEHMAKFVAEMLKLDDATAAKFIPIYKEYLKAKYDVRHSGMKKRRPQPKENLTDAEASNIVKERLEASRKILDIRESYYKKMEKVINSKQLLQIYDMEQNFDNKIRDRWGDRSKGKRPEPQGKKK